MFPAFRRFLALAAAIAAPACLAQMHMCKDAGGRKVFSDVPCGVDATVVNVRPASGGTAVNPSTSYASEFYDIRGLTFNELRREIDGKGPEGWWGTASTRLAFQLQTKRVAEGCAVDTVTAVADSKVRLPRWTNRHEGSRELQDQWDFVLRSLDLHERGHVQISVETARDVERSIREIPPAPSCDMVVDEAKRRAEQLRRRERDQQVRYDADTNHGRTQWTPYR